MPGSLDASQPRCFVMVKLMIVWAVRIVSAWPDGRDDESYLLGDRRGRESVVPHGQAVLLRFPLRDRAFAVWGGLKWAYSSMVDHIDRIDGVITWKPSSQGCCATDLKLQQCGINIVSRCRFCLTCAEDELHLFWQCPISRSLWTWILNIFGFHTGNQSISFQSLISLATNRSQAIKDTWAAVITYIITEIWHIRNACTFDNRSINLENIKRKIMMNFQETLILLKSCMHNKIEDLIIFSSLKMSSRPVHHRRIFECFWIPPHENQIKICCDSCSKGNPGFSGAGIVIRNHRGNTLAAMSIGLGICTNFMVDTLAIILGMEWAFDQGWSNVWIASDSMAAIRCFTANNIPGFIHSR
ncbi:Ribonuclease H domain [Macleaya cordata]|uniref:Ribonuclease H domain n=1 Tax=Macleaya cordata TaxID=56857 RepID=A0A200Q407_MACCD|nr:Ribonuclease H domain [Macleaya cordata]